jgi:hypothetical protein
LILHYFQFDFLPGYVTFAIASSQIFMPCVLATLLIVKAEEFFESLCDIPWYLLSLSDQKAVMMLMMAAQKEKTLSAAIFELDMRSFVEVS